MYSVLLSREVFDSAALDALLAPQAEALKHQPLWSVGPQTYFEEFEHDTLPLLAPSDDVEIHALTAEGVFDGGEMPATATLQKALSPLWHAVGDRGRVVLGAYWNETGATGSDVVRIRRERGASCFDFDANGSTFGRDPTRAAMAFERWAHAYALPLRVDPGEKVTRLVHTAGGAVRTNGGPRPTGFFLEIGDVGLDEMLSRLQDFCAAEMAGRPFDECYWSAGVPREGGFADRIDVWNAIAGAAPGGPYEVSVQYRLRALRGLETIRMLADANTEIRNPYWNFHTGKGKDEKTCVNLITTRDGHRLRLVSESRASLEAFSQRLGLVFEPGD